MSTMDSLFSLVTSLAQGQFSRDLQPQVRFPNRPFMAVRLRAPTAPQGQTLDMPGQVLL